jgi:hypothetical protein
MTASLGILGVRGALIVGGVMSVTLGASFLAIGVYMTGTLFGSLNKSELSTEGQAAYDQAQSNTFTAFKITGLGLIVSGFGVIIGTLVSYLVF